MVEIVAEISGNHGGSLSKAKRMIAAAGACDCDYAKFQFYRPEDMPDRHEGDNDAMYRRLMVPDEWLPELFDQARRSCIGLFASVFSVRAVETLLKFDVPYIKIASPESTRLPMKIYEAIDEARGEVDLIVSSGLEDAESLRHLGGYRMFCPPGYPPKSVDFGDWHWDGFSDHSPGIERPLRVLRQQAVHMIEKHFKIDNDCVDAAFSADPPTMELLCKLAHR
jgi:sialic acid synthase SpsE